MYKLLDVTIKGFWGKHKVKTNFHEDINIFIGENGTGKTTFINLLQAVLSIDLDNLSNLQFEEIAIRLRKGKSNRKIKVTKDTDDLLEYRSLTYQVSTSKYTFPILSRAHFHDRYRRTRIHPKKQMEFVELRNRLEDMIRLSFLSVYREDFIDPEEFRSRDTAPNPVDIKLLKLMNDFTTYQLQLQEKVGQLSSKFQKNVLRTMLFKEQFDFVDINAKIDLDEERLNDIRIRLEQAYRDLGILDTKDTKAIQSHVKQISKAAEAINKYVDDKNQPVYVNHVTPLTLLRRTEQIIELSSKLEENKEKIQRECKLNSV